MDTERFAGTPVSSSAEPPTVSSGSPPPGRPTPGASPAWPMPQQAPTQLPPPTPQAPPTQVGRPPSGPPPYGGPPGPPPGPPGPPYGQPPRRRKRWPLFLAGGLALVLVAGLAVGGWLYFTGRLGFGPLSAADRDAITTIADEVGAPDWADESDRECAVEAIVETDRSSALEQRGIIERDGDSWSYTGEWPTADAITYFENLFDCSDDWVDRVGEAWGLDDTSCLAEIDTTTMATYFAAEDLPLADTAEADLAQARQPAVDALDECYVVDPPAPVAHAESAYRAVTFTFEQPESGTGETVLNVQRDGDWQQMRGMRTRVATAQGGDEACLKAQTVTTFAWGSTATAEDEFCGNAKPRRIWWSKAGNCTASPGCVAWELKYEGFRSYDSITAVYRSDGGDCMSVSGSCSDTVLATAEGRGSIVTWSFPPSYTGRFTATVDDLEVAIPD